MQFSKYFERIRSKESFKGNNYFANNNEHAEMFERTLTGGYSCVNNRIGFDTEVLLPNFTKSEYAKMNIDESFQAYKNQNFKFGYKIKLDTDKQYTDYRAIKTIIKFDENSQYGFAMTKPMPVGSVKEKTSSWTEFNLRMEKVSLDDPIGHIFVVDVEFDHLKAATVKLCTTKYFLPLQKNNRELKLMKGLFTNC